MDTKTKNLLSRKFGKINMKRHINEVSTNESSCVTVEEVPNTLSTVAVTVTYLDTIKSAIDSVGLKNQFEDEDMDDYDNQEEPDVEENEEINDRELITENKKRDIDKYYKSLLFNKKNEIQDEILKNSNTVFNDSMFVNNNNSSIIHFIFSSEIDEMLKKFLRCSNLGDVIKKNVNSITCNMIIASTSTIKKNKNIMTMFDVAFNNNMLHDIKPQSLMICMSYAMYISRIQNSCKMGLIFIEFPEVYDMLLDNTTNSYIVLFIKKYCFIKRIA